MALLMKSLSRIGIDVEYWKVFIDNINNEIFNFSVMPYINKDFRDDGKSPMISDVRYYEMNIKYSIPVNCSITIEDFLKSCAYNYLKEEQFFSGSIDC